MKKEIININKLNKILRVLSIISLVLNSIVPVYATDDPLEVINNLSDLIYSLTRAVGTIIVIYGVIQIGLSIQSHDPSQRTSGVFTALGGVIIAFSKAIVTRITS